MYTSQKIGTVEQRVIREISRIAPETLNAPLFIEEE